VFVRGSIPKGSVCKPAVLAQRARGMRFGATPSEADVWRELRGGRLGVVFRRQVPLLGRYIADFFAWEAGLVVEVDGSGHTQRQVADARRDEALRRAGYRVLRLPAALVERDVESAVRLVREGFAARRAP
jgi:very-short-patch-repair endonuclease